MINCDKTEETDPSCPQTCTSKDIANGKLYMLLLKSNYPVRDLGLDLGPPRHSVEMCLLPVPESIDSACT